VLAAGQFHDNVLNGIQRKPESIRPPIRDAPRHPPQIGSKAIGRALRARQTGTPPPEGAHARSAIAFDRAGSRKTRGLVGRMQAQSRAPYRRRLRASIATTDVTNTADSRRDGSARAWRPRSSTAAPPPIPMISRACSCGTRRLYRASSYNGVALQFVRSQGENGQRRIEIPLFLGGKLNRILTAATPAFPSHPHELSSEGHCLPECRSDSRSLGRHGPAADQSA